MIYFLIPLRSAKTSNNWAAVEKLFNNTLASVFNQKDQDFKVIVACHEKPQLERVYDNRLEFLIAEFPPPIMTSQHLTDKFYKKRMLVLRAQQLHARYIMFVDADDYVSNRLSGWIKDREHASGWFIKTGYEYNAGLNTIRVTPNFNNICGTSAILNISSLEFPVDTSFTNYIRKDEYLFDFGHNEWSSILDKQKKPQLDAIPFKGAIYVLNTGENWTNAAGQRIGKFRQLYRKLIPGLKPGRALREEFALNVQV